MLLKARFTLKLEQLFTLFQSQVEALAGLPSFWGLRDESRSSMLTVSTSFQWIWRSAFSMRRL